MGKSLRSREQKNCDSCAAPNMVLFRVKMASAVPWQFFCKECQSKVKEHPLYQYGGTWKQKKRN